MVVTVTGASFPANASVSTVGNSFSPVSVDITINGTVGFTFAALHNVTFGGGAAPANIPNTSSGTVSRTFTAVGTFNYQCTLHGGMSGTVIVH